MKRMIRMILGAGLVLFGLLTFFILPGSILTIAIGLMLLSFDFPLARRWLKLSQRSMSHSARKLDSYLLARKHRRN
ncbi:PGPGW domain-containing protein [Neptunicella sp. SCSIO 80796]|uniref:PGPGW domain-containing protein n=1 Tax=Neptunicella plasticusilytica TaxID=3117012 RepID=UPI003A4D8B41